jgi:hypothetical protein
MQCKMLNNNTTQRILKMIKSKTSLPKFKLVLKRGHTKHIRKSNRKGK